MDGKVWSDEKICIGPMRNGMSDLYACRLWGCLCHAV